jgi:thymidylate synthase
MSSFSILVAVEQKTRALGSSKLSTLPWKCKEDMRFFMDKIFNKVLIVGRTTFLTLGPQTRHRARRIIVLSKSTTLASTPQPDKGSRLTLLGPATATFVNDFDQALVEAQKENCSILVIGGLQVYKLALQEKYHHLIDAIYLNEIILIDPKDVKENKDVKIKENKKDNKENKDEKVLDLIWPDHMMPATFKKISQESPLRTCIFNVYSAKPIQNSQAHVKQDKEPEKEKEKKTLNTTTDEQQYLNLLRLVLETGSETMDRTKVGTWKKFGAELRFDLRNGIFPLLTTKQMSLRLVWEELKWMLSGCTDAKELDKKKVKIWNDNSSRAALDKLGMKDKEVGDCGPIYGHQWRHFGAKYINCATNYQGQGMDQVAQVVKEIKTDPSSRRMMVSAWNPLDLKQMVLPPCHFAYQFNVDETKNELSCLVSQRSADLFLGIPFNIASYALLTHVMSHIAGYKPGSLILHLGDHHIYKNHKDAVETQLKRQPLVFPTLQIKGNPKQDPKEYDFTDFVLIDYKPHPKIEGAMAV